MRWKVLGALMVAHLMVGILNLKIGFDYDDTMSFSTPAFDLAFAAEKEQGVKPFSAQFWEIVNTNFESEDPKIGVISWALLAKLLGFDVVIITARMPVKTEPIVDKWDWLHDGFYFTKDKAQIMDKYRFIAFIGDSDSDIEECRKAHLWCIRARRSPKSSYKDNYSPGKYGEWILPFSG